MTIIENAIKSLHSEIEKILQITPVFDLPNAKKDEMYAILAKLENKEEFKPLLHSRCANINDILESYRSQTEEALVAQIIALDLTISHAMERSLRNLVEKPIKDFLTQKENVDMDPDLVILRVEVDLLIIRTLKRIAGLHTKMEALQELSHRMKFLESSQKNNGGR
jgi:hypothetical protein